MKKDETDVIFQNLTWPGWLQALQSCNERLSNHLQEGDWENAQVEVTIRDHLLRQSAPELMRLKKAEQEGFEEEDLERVKQVLQEVRETGQAFIEALKTRRQELDQRIKTVQKGRAALNLYRTAKPEGTPRFLDREG